MNVAIPLLTTIISLLFALTVLDQYLERKRPYQGIWATGLFLYAAGSLLPALWGMGIYSEVIFRLWYWIGAMLVAAYLGMGSLYLHLRPKTGHAVLIVLLAFTVIGGFLALTLPLRGDVALLEGQTLATLVPDTEPPVRYYPAYVSILTALLNIFGSVVMLGSAVYGAWGFVRGKTPGFRALSNVLIAAGAFVSAAGGTLERFNLPEPHTMALLLGVLLIYMGFVRSQQVFVIYRVPFMRKAKTAA